MTLSPGTRLGPYEIRGPLGAGGMGEVYRASDSRLDRDVAIKIVPQHLSHDPELLARFEREARTVAALSHPNVLGIFDFGREGDIVYAVTELLEGETLRDRISRGPISPPEAASAGLDIARGLAAAHVKGIVHRDLKPANIMIMTDGRLKILDFGLAKIAARRPGPGSTEIDTIPDMTEPGLVMGTAGYMSPEQVRGQSVDARTDVFAFGAVLFEMLTGRKAFVRGTAADTLSAVLRDEPPELSAGGGWLPESLAAIVRKCLAKDPARRYATGGDIVAEMERLRTGSNAPEPTVRIPSGRRRRFAFVTLPAVLAIAAGATFVAIRSMSRGRPARKIAVLPFENLGSPDEEYFADGMSDAVRGKLAVIPDLAVIARQSSNSYRNSRRPPHEIADDLGVRFLVSGTVRWSRRKSGGDRVEVSPELVDTAVSPPVTAWQQSFDATLTDVFDVQAEIAGRVARALNVALSAGERRAMAERPTASMDAYDAYLRGEQASDGLATQDPATLRQALGHYVQAVALDGRFAAAWARISETDATIYVNGVPSPTEDSSALRAAERAIEIAPSDAVGYRALGVYWSAVRCRYAESLRHYAAALRLAPGDAEILSRQGSAEMYAGRWKDAVSHLRQAADLDPRSPAALLRLGQASLWLRRYPEGLATDDRALAITPTNLALLHQKTMIHLAMGDSAGAARVIRQAEAVAPRETVVAFFATYFDIYWALAPADLDLLLQLPAAAFDDNKGIRALVRAQIFALRGNRKAVAAESEAARIDLASQIASTPEDPQLHEQYGLALAYLGRSAEALAEGSRGMALSPIDRDAYTGSYCEHLFARICLLAGERNRALDHLENLLGRPYFLSKSWLAIDPTFSVLREEPRFQRLIGRKA